MMPDSNTKTRIAIASPRAVELPHSCRQYVYESRPVFPDWLGDGTVSGELRILELVVKFS